MFLRLYAAARLKRGWRNLVSTMAIQPSLAISFELGKALRDSDIVVGQNAATNREAGDST